MLSALGKAEDSLRKLICLRKLSIKFIFKFCLSTRFVVGNSFFGLTQQQQNNNNNELNVRRQETFSKTTYRGPCMRQDKKPSCTIQGLLL
mmetsp:Transcript_33703/g.49337  ORF Transcript_33703/g.49337 Transcript_33703/m.49337 type:complete len:90 (+) Transcript_33703:116-385(+)